MLCSGWEKAQVVYDLLGEMKVNQTLHSIITLLGLKEDEAKAFKIPKNCESTSSSLSACGQQGHRVIICSLNLILNFLISLKQKHSLLFDFIYGNVN